MGRSDSEQPGATEEPTVEAAQPLRPDDGDDRGPVGQQPLATEALESQAAAQEAQAAEPVQEDASATEGLEVQQVIEALLFASDRPLSAKVIAEILERGTARTVRACIDQLNAGYASTGAAFRIEAVAGGYQMLTLPKFQPWLEKLLSVRKEARLSPAAMETLAIIAYKQPVLRADIEAIRGVSCGEVISRLREMGLVKIVGRAEDVGRPLLYGTTKKFLRVFGLGSLDDLPQVEALKPPEPSG